MPYSGGKSKTLTTKRHFTVVIGNKENGLYVSTTPSSAARKAVTKLCASNKSKKVEFHIREITQGSKKKTYGPYIGHIEKLKEPIELKGRKVEYKPMAKLKGKKMSGGSHDISITINDDKYKIKDIEKIIQTLPSRLPNHIQKAGIFEVTKVNKEFTVKSNKTNSKIKYTFTFDDINALNYFKRLIISQAITPNSPDI